jgi:cytochrome o ubiquinol oxidase subunit 3
MKHSIRHPGLNLGPHHGEAHDDAETLVFGFWVFLMSDLIIFGLMFATYVTMANPMGMAGGPGPKEAFDLTSVFIQTMILLISSLTFGVASLALKYEQGRRRIAIWLGITLALGLAFLTFEVLDFRHMIAEGAVPSRSGFLSAFWGLVPLHGLHVFAGCIWIALMLVQLQVFGLVPAVKTRLLRLALFWHFLDLIWIGIFTIVYLGGLAG